MGIIKSNRGEVIVEAAIYFPFVLMIVFFILLLSIMQLNQYVLNFQTSRIADIAVMDIQCDATENLSDFSEPSFAAGLSEIPGSSVINTYYKGKQNSVQTIGHDTSVGKYSAILENSIRRYSLINGIVTASPTVTVEEGFTDVVTVDVSYDLKTPGFIKYITGSDPVIVARSCTSKVAIRPVDTIRRYDAISNQVWDYYGGNGYISGTIRYSDAEYDQMATGGGSR